MVDIVAEAIKRGEAGKTTWTDPKVQKTMSNAEKMFKAMKGAAADSSSLIGSMQAFGPIGILFEALNPILEMFTPFLEIIIDSILPAMMPVLRPIMDIMVQMIPIFKLIGQIIGLLMSVGMIPLVMILKIVSPLLEALAPVFEILGDVFKLVGNVIGWIVENPVAALIFALKLLWWVGAMLGNFFIDLVNIFWYIITFGQGGPLISARIPLPTFDEGGRMLKEGYAKMKAGEIAVTGNQLAGVEDRLDRLIEFQEESKMQRFW